MDEEEYANEHKQHLNKNPNYAVIVVLISLVIFLLIYYYRQ